MNYRILKTIIKEYPEIRKRIYREQLYNNTNVLFQKICSDAIPSAPTVDEKTGFFKKINNNAVSGFTGKWQDFVFIVIKSKPSKSFEQIRHHEMLHYYFKSFIFKDELASYFSSLKMIFHPSDLLSIRFMITGFVISNHTPQEKIDEEIIVRILNEDYKDKSRKLSEKEFRRIKSRSVLLENYFLNKRKRIPMYIKFRHKIETFIFNAIACLKYLIMLPK